MIYPLGLLAVAALIAATLRFGWPQPLVMQVSPVFILLALTGLELLRGRWRPRARTAGRDAAFFVLTSLVGATIPALVLSLMPASGALASLPFLLALAIAILASDLAGYAVHRLFHAVPFLWRFHALHHAPTELYTLVSTVDHPVFVACVRGLRAATAAALGFSPDVVFALALFDLWQGLSSHLGVDTDHPWLARVLVTPQTHRLHHRPGDGGNFGVMLTVWDQAFKTFERPGAHPPRVGLAEPHDLPENWWTMLILRRAGHSHPRGQRPPDA